MTRLILALVALTAFASTAQAQQDRLRVVNTTGDLKVLAKAVGAERVIATSLVPPGERPERYAPRLQETSITSTRALLIASTKAAPGQSMPAIPCCPTLESRIFVTPK